MICPTCGKMNEDGFKFCVKCGSNLDETSEATYESVDMGGYHTEEEFAEGHHSGFVMGTGVFRISDRPATDAASDVYTSDELNDTDEEFDFSMFDEPDTSGFGSLGSAPLPPPKTIDNTPVDEDEEDDDISAGVPAFNAPPVQRQNQFRPQSSMPQPVASQSFDAPHMHQQPAPYPGGFGQQQMQPQQPRMQQPAMNQGYGQPPVGFGGQYPANFQNQPQQQTAGQFGGAMPPQGFGGQQMMYAQPQIIGYDKKGQPIYGQPQMMYAQPQIIGYDQNGQPIYGQPQMMYAQPQIIGYDQNGQPVYGQPQMMFMQPQIIGYDQNGTPVYGQMNVAPEGGMMPQGMGMMNPAMQQPVQQRPINIPAPAPAEPEPPKKEEKADFWDFFDDGKKDPRHEKPAADDFFGKSGHSDSGSGMGDLSTDGVDFTKLRRTEKKKRDYMGDTPLVDASELNPNESAKFNKFYMKATEQVNADDLEAHSTGHSHDKMGMTAEVDASRLSQNIQMKSRISMGGTDMVDASDLQAYVPERRASMMGEADRAVEALPKKKKSPYQSELDLIELPEYMKAKKTRREETIEIPSLPKV